MTDEKNKIKEAYEAGAIEIKGREYVFDKMNFRDSRKVFSYFTSISPMVERGNFSFLDTKEWDSIEKIIHKYVLFDDMTLDKIGNNHFSQFTEDYLDLTIMALGVFSYPFMKDPSSD